LPLEFVAPLKFGSEFEYDRKLEVALEGKVKVDVRNEYL
jgi:hypothetical protein